MWVNKVPNVHVWADHTSVKLLLGIPAEARSQSDARPTQWNSNTGALLYPFVKRYSDGAGFSVRRSQTFPHSALENAELPFDYSLNPVPRRGGQNHVRFRVSDYKFSYRSSETLAASSDLGGFLAPFFQSHCVGRKQSLQVKQLKPFQPVIWPACGADIGTHLHSKSSHLRCASLPTVLFSVVCLSLCLFVRCCI